MSQMTETVPTYFLREFTEKLRMMNTPHPEEKAKDIANILGKLCLKLVRAKRDSLEYNDYFNLVAEFKKIEGISEGLDFPSLLSCILTPEHSFIDSSYLLLFAAKHVREKIRELPESEDLQLQQILQVLELNESQSDIKRKMKRYGNIIKHVMLITLSEGELFKYRSTFTELLTKYYKPENCSIVYHLDLILSSDSNADIISIVTDSIRYQNWYNIEYCRHIKPMIAVVQILKTGVNINFLSEEDTNTSNTEQIIDLLSALGDDCKIGLHMIHSYKNYQPLEEKFYTQLKNIKCKLTRFKACIASKEHLSIVVGALGGDYLYISISLVTSFSFAALKKYKGNLYLKVKYTKYCPISGSNPVNGGTKLDIENIPADGKKKLYNLIKYIRPESKEFYSIDFPDCHLTDCDADELRMQLHREKIWTGLRWRKRTDLKKECRVNKDKSTDLCHLLRENEEERKQEERRKKVKKEQERSEQERREKEWREQERREQERRELERREQERREQEMREQERRVQVRRELERREQERRVQERRELERREQERRKKVKKDQERREQERRELERREQERREQERRVQERRELEKRKLEKREVEKPKSFYEAIKEKWRMCNIL